jgi:autotransporter family porin
LQGTYPTTVATSLGGTWAQIGVGLSGQITHNVAVFGGVDYNVGIDHSGHSVGGRLGIKVTW